MLVAKGIMASFPTAPIQDFLSDGFPIPLPVPVMVVQVYDDSRDWTVWMSAAEASAVMDVDVDSDIIILVVDRSPASWRVTPVCWV